jgi:hypothetical protein
MKRNERLVRLFRSKVVFGFFALVFWSIPVIIALAMSAADGTRAERIWEFFPEVLPLMGLGWVVTVALRFTQLWLDGRRRGGNDQVAG